MRAYKVITGCLFLCVLPYQAGAAPLLGTNVTGSLTFGANPNNYFNSSNGFVPAGCANSGLGSTTVTIADPTAEFCFLDTANRDTANFTDTTLTITDVSGGGAAPFAMSFLLAPGVVTSVSELSDNFAGSGLSASLVGNLLTIDWATGAGTGGTFSAVYAFNTTSAVPEPGSLALAGIALGLLA